ncbi:MAG: cell division protein FtsZ [Defluviitaleaceae bacterium]|nr:cell division protein FtsZ [Defluviitaleaceae bacterium]MCL2835158.1 cell division protein FtsZ [Defluviitaleaceae bacterium]
MNLIDVDTTFGREAKICVIGVGGGGNNAVDRMIEDGIGGVEFVAVNTDSQVLKKSHSPKRVQIGEKLTRGLGAGGQPEIGKRAAEESVDVIAEIVDGMDMVFITAGMGGGTGTGAAPIIAGVCKGKNVLTVGVVTKPFEFEGNKRMKNANDGLGELIKNVDTLVVIPNQRILDIVEHDMSLRDSLKKADEALRQGVRGISDLITNPGDINLDFADVRTTMADKGVAHMGIGRASGKNRAEAAADMAINSPLLETTMDGAKHVLINVSGGLGITLGDFNKASEHIKKTVANDAEIIIGTSIDEKLDDEIVVTVIATGFSGRTHRNLHNIQEQAPREYNPNPSSPIPHPAAETQQFHRKERDDLGSIKEVTENSEVLTLPVFLQNSRNRRRD